MLYLRRHCRRLPAPHRVPHVQQYCWGLLRVTDFPGEGGCECVVMITHVAHLVIAMVSCSSSSWSVDHPHRCQPHPCGCPFLFPHPQSPYAPHPPARRCILPRITLRTWAHLTQIFGCRSSWASGTSALQPHAPYPLYLPFPPPLLPSPPLPSPPPTPPYSYPLSLAPISLAFSAANNLDGFLVC